MEDMGREFSWDDEITKESSFVELPPGDYDFTIDHYERSRSKGSDKIPPSNMAIVYFNIRTPDGQEVQIRENYILHEKLEWKLSELFRGVGLKKKGETLRMNWPALPGLTGRAKVSLNPDRNDPTKKFNHIEKLYPKEDTSKKFKAGVF